MKQAKVVILGLTFKENCPDTRNSKVIDIINRLDEYGIEPIVVDPQADKLEAKNHYGIGLVNINDIENADCIVLAVAHDEFKNMSWEDIDSLFGDYENHQKIIIDVKGILDRVELEKRQYKYWRL